MAVFLSDQEECLEVSDDLIVYARMWKALGECNENPNSARDHVRRCTGHVGSMRLLSLEIYQCKSHDLISFVK